MKERRWPCCVDADGHVEVGIECGQDSIEIDCVDGLDGSRGIVALSHEHAAELRDHITHLLGGKTERELLGELVQAKAEIVELRELLHIANKDLDALDAYSPGSPLTKPEPVGVMLPMPRYRHIRLPSGGALTLCYRWIGKNDPVTGFAWCSPKDQFSKFEGRVIASRRAAVGETWGPLGFVHGFTKEVIACIDDRPCMVLRGLPGWVTDADLEHIKAKLRRDIEPSPVIQGDPGSYAVPSP